MRWEELDLTDPGTFLLGAPHELFARLRREDPVFLHRRPDRPHFWVVTGYADVVRISRDWSSFSAGRNGAFLDEQPDDGARTMASLDPPEHGELRALIDGAFTAEAVARRAGRVRALCGQVLDRVSGRGECDFVRDVAAEFAIAVLADLAGFPDEEDRHRVLRLTGVLDDPEEPPGSAARATMGIFELAHELADWRRRAPADDLISVLAGGPLSRRAYELLFLLLATAGQLSTRHLLSGAMLALAVHPEQWRLLVADPGVLGTGVEEMMRWVTPAMRFQRTATRDTTIGGRRVTAGERVVLYLISANRDESVFDRPERFDLTRTPNPHVAFGGGGPHVCLGEHLARLSARVLFEELARRMPDLELAGAPEYLCSTFANGIRSMPVRFTPGG
ncbi:cytochrome P450 [Nonomuraea gerenzanensis]|uniref:Putative cytochrome P450 hydroxylase n=1 Tax=Nonomuraea gerenzanensis TaxID=93944 RepID=A0A1M4EFL9_9ACTN|nr:cytochrome P450 [Nonomuraea gerenzanensis]UBU09216.1 cytochrome P450 [Nonomuraea gerenzanensis]SBO97610.1 putative cytochrome P450 hydroxylase [Nonomuraea gerenzanensis]